LSNRLSLLGILAALLVAGCSTQREPLVTFFTAQHGISLRYPSGWRTQQAEQDGIWYRYFLGPPAAEDNQPSVSVTLLAGKLETTVDDYAQAYLAGNTLVSSRNESRTGATGKSWQFVGPKGETRHLLLLLADGGKVIGLYAQAPTASFERQLPLLLEMQRSLSLEKPALWDERRDAAFGYALRLPSSWRESRRFAGGSSLLVQFTSPALAADRDGQTVHASLTLTAEKAPGNTGVEGFYQATRTKLGESFTILSHEPWRGGYVDLMRTETPVAISRVKRFYRVEGSRGYCLAFESRDDVAARAESWFDLIAGTLLLGPELTRP
jgi:hypothetical protein